MVRIGVWLERFSVAVFFLMIASCMGLMAYVQLAFTGKEPEGTIEDLGRFAGRFICVGLCLAGLLFMVSKAIQTLGGGRRDLQ